VCWCACLLQEIIPNEQGNRITPSYVGWDDNDERLIGDAAKNQATINPARTVFDAKRLIGRKCVGGPFFPLWSCGCVGLAWLLWEFWGQGGCHVKGWEFGHVAF
jgi:hypothetical protein